MTKIKTYYVCLEEIETGASIEKYVQVASFNQAMKMAKDLQKECKAAGTKTEILEVSYHDDYPGQLA